MVRTFVCILDDVFCYNERHDTFNIDMSIESVVYSQKQVSGVKVNVGTRKEGMNYRKQFISY